MCDGSELPKIDIQLQQGFKYFQKRQKKKYTERVRDKKKTHER